MISIPRRQGENNLTYSIRCSGLQLSKVQRAAVFQLYLHLPADKTGTIGVLIDLVKKVHEKDDSYWQRPDRHLSEVIFDLYGTPVFYGMEVIKDERPSEV
jgi:hypothetical protein